MSQPTTKDAYQLLHDGSLMLARMEHNGIRVDVERLEKTIENTNQTIQELEQKIREDEVFKLWQKRFKHKTNIGSRPQLADVLFKDLKLECKELTETKRPKMSESVLSNIDVPMVKNFVEMERLKKFSHTFLQGMQKEMVDGYLHPFFNLHTVITYRSSSSNPNFQNIPNRNAGMARTIRSCFIPRKGRRLVEIDYAGIEVRGAACYHKDPVMMEYINDQTKDMHRDMAAEIYMLDISQVDKYSRYASKNQFVFPEFYGSVYHQCARNLWESLDNMKLRIKLPTDDKESTGPLIKDHLKKKGIKKLGTCLPDRATVEHGTFEEHVKDVEDDFWYRRFKVYQQWKEDYYKEYLEKGEFTNHTGFRMKGSYKRNDVLNYPIQSSCFHCLLWSCIQIQKWLDDNNMKTKLVGQIHDCVVADVPEDEIQEFLTMCKKIMTLDLRKHWKWIIVPMETEVDVTPEGGSWADKEVWINKGGTWQKKGK